MSRARRVAANFAILVRRQVKVKRGWPLLQISNRFLCFVKNRPPSPSNQPAPLPRATEILFGDGTVYVKNHCSIPTLYLTLVLRDSETDIFVKKKKLWTHRANMRLCGLPEWKKKIDLQHGITRINPDLVLIMIETERTRPILCMGTPTSIPNNMILVTYHTYTRYGTDLNCTQRGYSNTAIKNDSNNTIFIIYITGTTVFRYAAVDSYLRARGIFNNNLRTVIRGGHVHGRIAVFLVLFQFRFA